MEQVGLVLPLVAAVLGAMANIVAKQLLDDVPVRSFLVVTFAWIFVLMTPLALFSFELTDIAVAVPLLGLVFGLDAVANWLYFRAMDIQEVSRLAAISGMAPLFTLVAAAVFLPSHLGVLTGVAVAAVVLAVYILNLEGGGLLGPLRSVVQKRNYEAVLAAMLFGASAIPARYALNEFAVTNPETLYWLRAIVIGAVMFVVLRPDLRSVARRSVAIVGVRAVLVIGYWLALLYAIGGSNVVISVALSRTTPVFTLVFGWLVLDEEVTGRKVGAIALVVLAVIGLELSGSFI
jgi:drug/metabolite transporter (DMT)-like permease